MPSPNAWFGRRYQADPKNKEHLVRVDVRKAENIARRNWRWGLPILDQGPTPRCVGFSAYELLRFSPIRNKPKLLTPDIIYHGAQRYDQWRGEGYDGSSVLGAMRFLHKEGYISEYQWAETLEQVTSYILTKGPMNLGTDWHPRMDNPDKQGYIWPDGGQPISGHAWVLHEYDLEKKNPDGTIGRGTMIQTWGDWGIPKRPGRAYLTGEALGHLITSQGEAAVAVEVQR